MMVLAIIQFPAPNYEVHIPDMHKHRTFENLPEEIETQKDGQANISSDEAIDVP